SLGNVNLWPVPTLLNASVINFERDRCQRFCANWITKIDPLRGHQSRHSVVQGREVPTSSERRSTYFTQRSKERVRPVRRISSATNRNSASHCPESSG